MTIPSLEGDALESYSLRVAEAWKLGSAEQDNGALLLVAMEEREIRIEVGYGLESVLTDAMSGYIIREAIVPEFKSGNFDRGITAGLQAMGGVVTGDTPITVEQIQDSRKEEESGGVSVFFLIFILVFLFGRIGRYRRYRPHHWRLQHPRPRHCQRGLERLARRRHRPHHRNRPEAGSVGHR